MLSYDVQVSSRPRVWQHELQFALDHALRKFSAAPSPNIIDWLALRLGEMFDLASAEGELSLFKKTCKAHRLANLVL